MTKEEFKELMSDDVHSLADLIREGEFEFEFLQNIEKEITIPKIILGAILTHPDCTPQYFLENYRIYKKGVGMTGDRVVLPYAKVLENIEVIADVVKSKEPTIKSIIETYEWKKATLKQIAINPHSPSELKTALYNKTGDESLIPPEAQEMFIF